VNTALQNSPGFGGIPGGDRALVRCSELEGQIRYIKEQSGGIQPADFESASQYQCGGQQSRSGLLLRISSGVTGSGKNSRKSQTRNRLLIPNRLLLKTCKPRKKKFLDPTLHYPDVAVKSPLLIKLRLQRRQKRSLSDFISH